MSFKLIGTDELELNVNDYLINDMKGIVLCIHGMVEHSNRYEDFALFLNKNGYSVYTYDHRGHGQSILKNENKGYLGIDGFNKMVYDLNVVVSYIKEKFPQEKIYLLGHSMGSFVTHRYIQLYNKVDGVVLSGSNFGTKSVKAARLLSKLLCLFKGERKEAKFLEKLSFGGFNKNFTPNRTTHDWLSRDEKIVDQFISDDNCGFTCTNRFYYDFMRGLLDLNKIKNIKKINPQLPLLIVSGDQDPVGNNGEGVKVLYQVLRNHLSRVELKLYSGARHEILNETNKDEVYQDILNWLTMIEG